MSHAQQQIPLFPLSAHLLPGGQMRLRIFEPRYVRMVKEVCATANSRIGMCMLNEQGDKATNEHIHGIATSAEIIDFEKLPDGLLGITVAGRELIKIEAIETASDGLRTGCVEKIHHWPEQTLAEADRLLAEHLQSVYENYPELAVAHTAEELQSSNWVCLRWLELLPIDAQTKQELLKASDSNEVVQFLKELINKSEE